MNHADSRERHLTHLWTPWHRLARVWGLATLVLSSGGCVFWRSAPERQIAWPDEASAVLVGAPMEAGAAIAAAAAVRELIRHNSDERLFRGCSSPEQGLDVAIFKQSGTELYFVVLHQRFDRCGGPIGRMLDGSYTYAVTAQGDVVAEAPPDAAPLEQPLESTPEEPVPAEGADTPPTVPTPEATPEVPPLETSFPPP